MRPRKLKSAEISDICNAINIENSNMCLDNVLRIHRDKLKAKLQTIKIVPNRIPDLKREIITMFYKSIVECGDAIGVNAGQCIGEPATQGALNTFHHTGNNSKNVTLGFKKVNELLSVSKNISNKSCTLYFEKNTIFFKLLKITFICNQDVNGLNLL